MWVQVVTECLSFKSITWYFSIPGQKSLQGREESELWRNLKITGCQLLLQMMCWVRRPPERAHSCVAAQNSVGGTRQNGVILMINYYFHLKSWLKYLLSGCYFGQLSLGS